MINPEYVAFIIVFITTLTLIYVLYKTCFADETIELYKNMHYYAYFDTSKEEILYHESGAFHRYLKSVYMSNTIKTDLVTTVNNFIKHSNYFKDNNVPRSLRLMISGKEGIGKGTFIEAIATEFDYCLIHFPKNNYSEKMIHSFFINLNSTISNNIVVFDNINFNSINKTNPQLYALLADLIINNDKNNIFVFTFNDLSSIPPTFSSNYHIHHHYHMDVNIEYIMAMVNDNIKDKTYLEEIKQNFLQLNHKITPGYIIPYLLFNEDFGKSLDRFFKIIKN